MLLREFRIRLVAGLLLTVGSTLGIGLDASPAAAVSDVPAVVVMTAPDDPPPVTANPFLPEDRGLGECISAVPKPGCGSEERGGWHQYLVFIALVGGLAVIGWRIVAGLRKGQSAPRAIERDPVDR